MSKENKHKCPVCGNTEFKKGATALDIVCKKCGKQISVRFKRENFGVTR